MSLLTKGTITKIDFNGNTCDVRIPLFESSGINEAVEMTATFIIQPGMYNGYSIGDVVYVSFEDNKINKPVVIGKLYLGQAKEKNNIGGSIVGNTLNITSKAILPYDTEIKSDPGENSAITNSDKNAYSSIGAIVAKINNLTNNTTPNIMPNNTIICRNLVTNLYNYTDEKYSAVKDIINNRYIIYYENDSYMSETNAKSYMLYMTGNNILPDNFSADRYYGAFLTCDQKIYYPIWEPNNNLLYFKSINDESISD